MKNQIIGVAPSWIMAGVVKSENESEIVLEPAVYIERVSAPWTDAAWDASKISRGNPVRGALTVRKSALLWRADCCEAVSNFGAVNALKSAK